MLAEKSSFRDPSGSIVYENGEVFRRVNDIYLPHYQHLMTSGLYAKLIEKGYLIPHTESSKHPLILKPEKVPFISYPHEWSFSALKEAALTTLEIQEISAEYHMQLKDASAYNIQFYQGRAVLIDTLSFELKTDPIPWIAYRQFCQHFLGPLALQAYVDYRLKNISLSHIDGPPLELIVKLLPFSRLIKPSLFIHLYLHSKFQSKTNRPTSIATSSSKTATLALIASLKSAVNQMMWVIPQTTWQNYQEEDSYTADAFKHKESIVRRYLSICRPDRVWDFGANEGYFSQIATEIAKEVISFDSDPVCIDRLFNRKTSVLPLVLDLSTPTPAFGWAESERKSLSERGPTDLLLALALIHHLRITNGIPFDRIAAYFSQISKSLIIEFIPADDKKIIQMNSGKKIDETYSLDHFVKEFSNYFTIKQTDSITNSARTLFLMESLCYTS